MQVARGIGIMLLWLSAWLPPQVVTAAEHQVTVGVLAHRGVDTAIEMWLPTVDYLSEKIVEHEFSLLPCDLQELHAALDRGELDFILTNPGNYVELEADYNITRIATLKNIRHGKPSKTFGAVIFTHTDHNDIRSIFDLRNKTFAAVDEGAFGGFQMAWRELRDMGIDPFNDFSELRFTGFPQDNIVFDVRDGRVDAGTVRTDILEGLAVQGLIELTNFRILNQQVDGEFPFLRSTRLYPEWAFAKGQFTPDALASKVTIALLQMPADHAAARTGDYAGWTVPLNYQPVHDLFMRLEIGPYARAGQFSLLDVIREYWYWFALISLFILFSVSLNVIVKRQVTKRTAELIREVAERKSAEEESRELLRENRFLVQKSLAVQERERRHLARELHDELGQCITAIQADARNISEQAPACGQSVVASAAAIREVAARIYEVVHSMMQRLRPDILDDLGLVVTLKEEVNAWQERQPGALYKLSINSDLPDLGEEVNITLYRIVQECLTNIAKHAQAHHVTVSLAVVDEPRTDEAWGADGHGIRLIIQDDGVGMNTEARGPGLGLIGVRERVEGFSGRFSLTSQPGQGTTIIVDLPLTSAKSGA
jgi:two-component system sensor histidine kinase TtrS